MEMAKFHLKNFGNGGNLENKKNQKDLYFLNCN